METVGVGLSLQIAFVDLKGEAPERELLIEKENVKHFYKR